MDMKILAIESSCDETAASVIEITEEQRNKETKKHKNNGFSVSQFLSFSVLSNVVSSQVDIHAKYGGVVPEVAARCHAENIMPVLSEALKIPLNPPFHKGGEGGFKIDAIAVTQGPGLITSLRVGVEAAKTLAYAWRKPLIAVNHVVAHIYANWLTPSPLPSGDLPQGDTSPPPPSGRGRIKEGVETKIQNLKSKICPFGTSPEGRQNIEFPALCLVVSGGHTMLVLMKGHGKFNIIGQTLDDAAGECFDKAAKILGLGYPGGPAIAERARQWKSEARNSKSETMTKIQNLKSKIYLPRPMINSNDFNFSFSGLKTAVLYKMRDMKSALFGVGAADLSADLSAVASAKEEALAKAEGERGVKTASTLITQMAYETQNAIVDVLVSKTIRAAKKYNVKTLMLGGGVAANKELRKRFQSVIPSDSEESRGSGATRASKNQQPTTNNQQLKLYIPDYKFCTDNAAMIAVAAYFNPKYVSWSRLEPDPNLSL